MLLQDDEGPSTKGIRTLRQAMRESLDKRFSKVEDTKTVVLACLLDPRYKSHAFSSATTLSKVKGWLKEEEDAATQQTTQEEHATTEGASVEEQAAAYGTHKNDRNTHKRQRREHTSFRSRVDEMFNSLLAALRMSYICT
ncbi:zinc finger BED domain-containing protein 4-like protein [Lates japonicus]|uniref:Zinc finger BED domain-containing protein 4-like protein n=1 Tax=Lates japonicus TaxID=270547 RepID=A0AAD3R5K3_LATJO|nr:zinc finger BED domain-containing protein 4-like protein [Lates japonicus]